MHSENHKFLPMLWLSSRANYFSRTIYPRCTTEQTKNTEKAADCLLNYVATFPNATICYHASDLILHCHSDSSYLYKSKAQSQAAGHFYLSSSTHINNGPIHKVWFIIKNVISSSPEAEIEATFWQIKMPFQFKMHWKKWAIHSHPALSKLTTAPLIASLITKSNKNDPKQ